MIKVVVQQLPKSVNEYDFNDLYNKKALEFSEHCAIKNKKSKCEEHFDFINIVTIIAGQKGIKIDKKFCCPEFASRFNFYDEANQ